MILLKEWQYSLLTRIEKENCTTYSIREIDGDYYIKVDDLMSLIDETQDYRDYAEEKVIELTNKINELPDIEANSLQLNTIKALNEARIENDKLQKENNELKKTIDDIQNTLDEDDYDKLRERGITYYEQYDN